MRSYGIFVYGSLKRAATAVNVPFRYFSRRGCGAGKLRARFLQGAHFTPLIVSCSAVCVLAGCGGATFTATSVQTGTLSVSTAAITFGSIALGQTASSSITLSNTSLANVQVTQLGVAGQAFAVSGGNGLPITIPSHGTYSVTVTFSPAAAGAASGQLTIASNASNNASIVIGLNGTGMLPSPTISLASLNCASSSLAGAATDNCSVGLNGAAPEGGLAVNLSSDNSLVTVPSTLMVPAGANNADFAAAVSSFGAPATVTLTATAGDVTETFALQLIDIQNSPASPVLSALSCSGGSLTGASTATCQVTLSGPAESGGFQISVSSSSQAVAVPATVTVPAGASVASFTAAVASVSSPQTATLTASAGGVVETFALQLGTGAPALGIGSNTIAFGDVNLNSPATQSLTLSSMGTAAVTISAATVVGSGFTISGATFPLTLSPNQTVTLTVQFDPTAAGAASGTLTVLSTSLTNPITVITLSGTGVLISYEVNLSWNAPTDSSDPITGYNVYRAASGSSTYEKLNASVVTQPNYIDTNVQDGLIYDYMVESVDASGETSAPSNLASVAIP